MVSWVIFLSIFLLWSASAAEAPQSDYQELLDFDNLLVNDTNYTQGLVPLPPDHELPSEVDPDDNDVGNQEASILAYSEAPSAAPSHAVIVGLQLPLREVNVLVISDVRARLMGHRSEEDFNIADLVAFVEILRREVVLKEQHDLLVCLNGNFMDGSILGDHPSYVASLLQRLDFDVITLGERDIRNTETVELLQKPAGLFDFWGPSLITSNIDANVSLTTTGRIKDDSPSPLGGSRLRKIQLTHADKTVLVLGLLDEELAPDFTLSKLVSVRPIVNALNSPDIKSELADTSTYDAILVLTHLPSSTPDDIRNALVSNIREVMGPGGDQIPIEVVVGHSLHSSSSGRSSLGSADNAHVFETKGYLQELAFLSFDTGDSSSGAGVVLDTSNKAALAATLGVSQLVTSSTANVKEFMESIVDNISPSPFEVVGCPSQTLNFTTKIDDASSLQKLYLDRVLPTVLRELPKDNDQPNLLIHVRFDQVFWEHIFTGTMTWNDLAAAVPYDDFVFRAAFRLRGEKIARLEGHHFERYPGHIDAQFLEGSSSTVVVATPEIDKREYEQHQGYTLYTVERDYEVLVHSLQDVKYRHPAPERQESMSIRSILADYIRSTWPCSGEQIPSNPTQNTGDNGDKGSGQTVGDKIEDEIGKIGDEISKVNDEVNEAVQDPKSNPVGVAFIVLFLLATVGLLAFGVLWYSRRRRMITTVFGAMSKGGVPDVTFILNRSGLKRRSSERQGFSKGFEQETEHYSSDHFFKEENRVV